ncbi:MAG: type I methionyl aminopeptidase [Ruminococcaceae bacterium]|nr:type I methionyl aminopeptidase [Oscillospiraceae bacterium]
MITVKSQSELEVMALSGDVAASALGVAKEIIKEGVTTDYIDKKIKEHIIQRGGKPSFLGYRGFPKSSCISVNDEVIHGIPGDRVIVEGDIVSVDVGVLYKGFHSDNAATFAVGQVSREKKKLLEVTALALQEGISMAVEGMRIGDIGNAIQTFVESNGCSVVREFVGHGIGYELHEDPEVPNYGRPGRGQRLSKGMTIAIEPMINLGARHVDVIENDWTVVTRDGSPSAHFEMTVAITESKAVILTDWGKYI